MVWPLNNKRISLVRSGLSWSGVAEQEIGNFHNIGRSVGEEQRVTWVCSGCLGAGRGKRAHSTYGCHAKMVWEADGQAKAARP